MVHEEGDALQRRPNHTVLDGLGELAELGQRAVDQPQHLWLVPQRGASRGLRAKRVMSHGSVWACQRSIPALHPKCTATNSSPCSWEAVMQGHLPATDTGISTAKQPMRCQLETRTWYAWWSRQAGRSISSPTPPTCSRCITPLTVIYCPLKRT